MQTKPRAKVEAKAEEVKALKTARANTMSRDLGGQHCKYGENCRNNAEGKCRRPNHNTYTEASFKNKVIEPGGRNGDSTYGEDTPG